MSRLVTFLVVVIVGLVAALMFLAGRMTADTGETQTNDQQIASAKSPQTAPMRLEVKPTIQSNNSEHRLSTTVDVRIGGEPELDACGSSGRTVGLNPNGDNYLAVKAAPSLGSQRIDKLGPDDEFYMCDATPDGKWVGIVYNDGGGLSARCGVSQSVALRRGYAGPCRSGWVFSKYVELVAG